MLDRRTFFETAAAALLAAQIPSSKSSSLRSVRTDRLNQGPFPIEQDQGWQTILYTTPSTAHIRNPGLGLVGYTWEENGPAIAVREGRISLEKNIEALASLPFVDVLYIRCDWRDVQSRPGRLDLAPVWQLTLDAARRYNLRAAFRIQMSTPERQPKQLAMPDFVSGKVPLVPIGEIPHEPGVHYREPRYDDPFFQSSWRELNDLLAARFDGDPLIEWVDLMQYGFWGEGHTSRYPSPFPSRETARRVFLSMTGHQLATWKRTPLAVNTQPDISQVGNDSVIAEAIRAGCWLRSDSIIVEEPVQIDRIASRLPHLAAILEDGYLRSYDISKLRVDQAGVNELENFTLHTLDLRANFWSLWTEVEHLRSYNERFPRGFATLQQQLGYRLRPAWVWERKRDGSPEIIVAIANRGVAGVPGVLHLRLATPDGRVRLQGTLDPGEPAGNTTRLAAFRLEGYVPELKLSAAIETRPGIIRPIIFASEQPSNPDGSMAIHLKSPEDKGWRKGI